MRTAAPAANAPRIVGPFPGGTMKAQDTRHKAQAAGISLPLVTCALCLCAIAGTAMAQQYPSRPVRIIVPFAAGGGSDVVARMLSAKLTESLGQPIIVDNRPGAGANIGIGLAARAAGAAYTLLVASPAFTV